MFTVVALTLVMPATFLISESSLAEAPVSLGSAHSFAVFSKGVLTNTGDTTVVGDLGAVGTVSGFSTAQQSTADSATVLDSLVTAYAELGEASPATAITGPIGEMTLTPGVYSSAAALTINGPLILDASSDPDGVFIFQVNGALNTSANSRITMVGGSKPSGVGKTVIVGKVDSKGQVGVFWELRQVVVGDEIVIRSKSDVVHSIATFTVTEVTLYRKSDFPTLRLYSNKPFPGVALVTDGGPNVARTAYLGNLIVYGQFTSKILLY